ncbi:MAG TPA: hypothetical protein VHD83_23085 [Puia sp.]|nr:hypothetical protein [Puia sp.]
MKVNYLLALFLIGYGIDMIAAFQKILHMAGSDFLFLVALICKLLAVLLLIVKLLTTQKGKDFLNW